MSIESADKDLGPRDSAVSPRKRQPLTGIHVLLVDDDLDSLSLIELLLSHTGALVKTAASATAARDLLRDWCPDVVVSDIGMPEEDGLQFVRRLRLWQSNRGPSHLPCIALTAYVRPEQQQAALVAGFDAHVSKPVHIGNLVTEILRFTTPP